MLATACPRPVKGTAKRLKARGKRRESMHARSIRALCVERDGYCLMALLGVVGCSGPSEWAHVGQHRRCFTRGKAPEQRHTTAGSAMLCQKHHREYDAHLFDLLPKTDDGMNGAFLVRAA